MAKGTFSQGFKIFMNTDQPLSICASSRGHQHHGKHNLRFNYGLKTYPSAAP